MQRQRSLIAEARAERPAGLGQIGHRPSSAPDREAVADRETEFIGYARGPLSLGDGGLTTLVLSACLARDHSPSSDRPSPTDGDDGPRKQRHRLRHHVLQVLHL